MDINPVVGKQVFRLDHQRHGQEIAILKLHRIAERRGQRMNSARQLTHRRRTDDMTRLQQHLTLGTLSDHLPPTGALVVRQLLEAMRHQHLVAALDHEVPCGFPHHAGAKARIAKAFQQGLGRHAIIGPLVKAQRALQPILYRAPERKPLDPLSSPVGRHLVAGHAPDLFGIGLEEDGKQLLPEGIYRPILKRPDIAIG